MDLIVRIMLVRLIVILALMVVFINSCNSLISVFAGTHKLRVYDMENVVQQGVGDADYIEVQDAWLSTDFVYSPREKAKGTGILQYPVLTAAQYDQLQRGEVVTVNVIAWTEMKDTACVARGKCFDPGQTVLTGMIRKVNPRRDETENLPGSRYLLAERPLYLEVGIAPTAWYWSLLLMIGALGLAFFIERRFGSLKKKPENTHIHE